MKKHIHFYIIKLILLALVALCAALVAFMAKTIVAPFDGVFYRIIVNGIPFLFFMYFMYTVESRIKLPDDKEKLTGKYFILFSLRELSVYVLFLIPLFVLCLLNGDFINGKGFMTIFYAPHSLFLHIIPAIPDAVCVLIPAFVFGFVAFLAHYNKSRKPVPAPAPTDDNDDTDDEEQENDESDIGNEDVE